MSDYLHFDPDERTKGNKAVTKQMENRLRGFIRQLTKKYGPVTASIGVIENSIGLDRRIGQSKKITVAEEAARNEFGDPNEGIPARPFMQLTADQNQDIWKEDLAALLQSGMTSEQALEAIAVIARDAVKATISNYTGPNPSNAPTTIKIKGRNQPLVDFGDLLRSISYEIKKEGGDAE